eukprot:sb/3478541/
MLWKCDRTYFVWEVVRDGSMVFLRAVAHTGPSLSSLSSLLNSQVFQLSFDRQVSSGDWNPSPKLQKGSLKKFSSYTAFTQRLLSRYTQSARAALGNLIFS